jgi:NAD(P)-dependent dehydrogenase (short-subunit alcohol dehydrogenase family)
MDLGLEGKLAIVTGGSRGVGRAVAEALVAEGVSVAVVGRDKDTLAKAASEIAQGHNVRVIPAVGDTTSDASVHTMVESAVSGLGGVDILVNCASLQRSLEPRPSLSQIDDQLVWPDVNTKVMGYLRCIREVVPHMIARGGGRIVNIGGADVRQTGVTVGSMRNAAVAALTKNVADEFAKSGITAISVHPTAMRTYKTPAVIQAIAQREGITDSDVEARLRSMNLLGRMIDVSEVARIIVFLASPLATAINGEPIHVGGGEKGVIRY